MANINIKEQKDEASHLPLSLKEYEEATDRLRNAQDLLASEPYNAEAWGIFIREFQRKKCTDARPFYEKLIAQFPTTAKYWRLYVEHEMRAHNYEKVEKLFQRCLIKILNIELWRCYLAYIKDTKASLPTFKEKMAQAYDFALEKIGQDCSALPIWMEYAAFLKSVEAVGQYAENQRITAVRRVYQRGVVTPVYGVEQLWKEYCLYETSINAMIAKKMIEDKGKEYSIAKRVSKEYEMNTKGINRGMASVPPSGSPEELHQVSLWKKYIAWEKSNPLRSEDHTIITKRVMFAYEQCLLCLGFHPDIWYEAADFLEQSSRILSEKGDLNASKLFADEAANTFERATTSLMKGCLIIYLAYADFEEGRMKYDKVHTVYKKFIDLPDEDPTLCYIRYMHFARRAEGIKSARAVFKLAREDKRSTHHVFVAAALMEFYCSKDKNIAYKIFELGLKRYSESSDFILCFIDYMLQLNEDNNTRVLFERVLTSSQLTPEKSIEVWRRFVEFESQIGDLPSITKAEKRRLAAFQALSDHEGREASLLVDRYKYLDLYPCGPQELRCLGYKETSLRPGIPAALAACSADVMVTDESGGDMDKTPRPDISQMIAFKPKQIIPTGAHPVPGGVFPPPSAASHLLTLMPPPECFTGPFVKIDDFLKQFSQLELPDSFRSMDVNGQEMDAGTKFTLNQMEIVSKKRKLPGSSERRDSEGDEDQKAPVNDIFRLRQQKRVK